MAQAILFPGEILAELGQGHLRALVKLSRCTKLGDWRSLASEGVSSFSTFSCCTKIGDFCTLIGDHVHPHVVSHLNAKATQLAMGGIYFFEERSRNVLRVSYLGIRSIERKAIMRGRVPIP